MQHFNAVDLIRFRRGRNTKGIRFIEELCYEPLLPSLFYRNYKIASYACPEKFSLFCYKLCNFVIKSDRYSSNECTFDVSPGALFIVLLRQFVLNRCTLVTMRHSLCTRGIIDNRPRALSKKIISVALN